MLVLDLEIPAPVVRAALKAARGRGLSVVLDPSPVQRFQKDYFEIADYLTPNPVEAEQLTGARPARLEDAFRAADALRGSGARTVFVKMGAQGCIVVSDEVRKRIPAPEVKPVDTTGAGDAFAGALAVALWERQSLEDAARFAVAASALAVTGYGSQSAYPDRAVIDRVLHGLPS